MKGFPSSKNPVTFNYWHLPKKVMRLLKVSKTKRNSNQNLQIFSRKNSTLMKKQRNIPIFLIWVNKIIYHHVLTIYISSCLIAQLKIT